ncbi:MAG: hypothetical protein JXK07_00790, partial [Spirochaetes bacterium]|nr:hypothetical protein [Spirochaetota bacterium]
MPIDIPRDRNSEFEPQIIPENINSFTSLNKKISPCMVWGLRPEIFMLISLACMKQNRQQLQTENI